MAVIVLMLQDEHARQELHALGFVDGHEGQQSLSVKFYLHVGAQDSKPGQNRCSDFSLK